MSETPPRTRPVMPMPLVPAALLLAGGIALGRYVPVPAGMLVTAAAAALAAAMLCLWHPPFRPIAGTALATALAAVGAVLGHLAYHRIPADHIAAALPGPGAPLASIVGQIVTAPQVQSPDPRDRYFAAYQRPPETVFLLQAEAVSTAGGMQGCRGLVRVSIQEPAWRFQPGQQVRIAARLYRPRRPGNPGQHDARRAARVQGVLVHASAAAADAVDVLAEPSAAGRVLWRLRAGARQHLQAEGDPGGRLLLHTLILGDRHRSLDPLRDAMVRAGTAHFLSISGQHLTILLGFVYLLLRAAAITPRKAAMIVLVLLAGYLLLAEVRTPLLRSALMAAAIATAVLLGRAAAAPNLLAGAAIALLVADPMELFRAGFQLSFGTVAGILLLHRPMERLLLGRRRGLLVFRDEHAWRRRARYGATIVLARSVSVSTAAYLAAMPLVAYHFGLLTPLAPLTSLLMLPLVAVTLVVGYAQLMLAWLLPNLAAGLGAPLAALTGALARLAQTLGAIPLACLRLQPVPAWAAALTAAALLLAGRHRRLGLSRAWAVTALLGALAIVTGATQLPPRPPDEAELYVLDVRRGSCAALRTPSGRTYLFDTGTISGFDPDQHVVEPFFRQRRWPDPAAVFLSHANSDHYNGLSRLLERHRPDAVFVNDSFAAAGSEGVRILLGEIARAGVDLRTIQRGQQVRLDARTTVTVLWPPSTHRGYDFAEPNDSSLVLRVECDGMRVLLPGDVEELAQALLLELPHEELRAQVLVLPHHGGYGPRLAQFVAAVNPKVLIRSSDPRRGPAAEQVPALSAGRHFYATDEHGCIRVRFSPTGPDVTRP